MFFEIVLGQYNHIRVCVLAHTRSILIFRWLASTTCVPANVLRTSSMPAGFSARRPGDLSRQNSARHYGAGDGVAQMARQRQDFGREVAESPHGLVFEPLIFHINISLACLGVDFLLTSI